MSGSIRDQPIPMAENSHPYSTTRGITWSMPTITSEGHCTLPYVPAPVSDNLSPSFENTAARNRTRSLFPVEEDIDGTPQIPGLSYRPDYIDAKQEAALV